MGRKSRSVNRDKPDRWKKDIVRSVDLFNEWFMEYAPQAFRDTRVQTARQVKEAMRVTENLAEIGPETLAAHPEALQILRMSTCPPLARDRLIGLAHASASLVKSIELRKRLPERMKPGVLKKELDRIAGTLRAMLDKDIFVWIERAQKPTEDETERAATIVADRLCGAVADPIIRNAQEKRQLAAIAAWLDARGYRHVSHAERRDFRKMEPRTYVFHLGIPVQLQGGKSTVTIPADAVIMPADVPRSGLPVLVEAKSAGDFTNVNKRRKEEAAKMAQLRTTYGPNTRYVLFLCGYFDTGYLGYEAAEGIDWVWEHRIDDLAKLGV